MPLLALASQHNGLRLGPVGIFRMRMFLDLDGPCVWSDIEVYRRRGSARTFLILHYENFPLK
jgi:hypothetical protein